MKSLQTVPVLYKSENEYILHRYIVSSSVEILDCEPPQDRLWMVRGRQRQRQRQRQNLTRSQQKMRLACLWKFLRVGGFSCLFAGSGRIRQAKGTTFQGTTNGMATSNTTSAAICGVV